ncbi:M20 family metallopeptidase [Nocardia suismassiliense]|uniref:M20 family metallopeptidase n=1 Tax=Nocardia suismassiliense TaxID=2077092 RepID=UPI000D1E3CD6|nr:M20/M25/M40 family metallo-hydrolase [Nocardia suismassiliense]
MNSSTTTFVDQLPRLLPDDELVQLAAGLTAVPSFTGQETPLAFHVRNTLARNDIHAYHQEVQPGRLQTIARLGPEHGTPALLLNGHLDMDPLGRDQPGKPFTARREGDRLYGAGLHNMKSGLAAILGAAIAVRRSGMALRRPLLLEFVVGELQGGVGTKHALRSGLTADAAVVPEPYSVRRVITRTAGVHKFAIVVRGTTAHTSRHHEGVDAVAVLRRVLDLLDTADLGLRNSEFPPLPRLQVASLIAGRGEAHDLSGVSYCSDKATALVDLRYPPPHEPHNVSKAIDIVLDRVRDAFPEAQIAVEHPVDPQYRVGGTDMPPMDMPADCAVVRDIAELLPRVSDFQVEETGLALPYSYCGNDTTHLSRAGIECCLFGPRGATPDTEHHVLISEMRACADTLALLTERRCG